MSEVKNNLREELNGYKVEYGILKKIPCSVQEDEQYENLLKKGEKLPDGVFAYSSPLNEDNLPTQFYTVNETDLTEEEVKEYLLYKKLDLLKTIKNGIVFFVVLTVISLISSLCLMFSI